MILLRKPSPEKNEEFALLSRKIDTYVEYIKIDQI